jgi:prevent-host-death family protein
MATEVKIAEFRARLSAYLRSVRKGHEIVIRDRETPIARVVPYAPVHSRLEVIPPTRSLKEAAEIISALGKQKPVFTVKEIDEALREERRERLDIDAL